MVMVRKSIYCRSFIDLGQRRSERMREGRRMEFVGGQEIP